MPALSQRIVKLERLGPRDMREGRTLQYRSTVPLTDPLIKDLATELLNAVAEGGESDLTEILRQQIADRALEVSALPAASE
jgi:hypothetical protein